LSDQTTTYCTPLRTVATTVAHIRTPVRIGTWNQGKRFHVRQGNGLGWVRIGDTMRGHEGSGAARAFRSPPHEEGATGEPFGSVGISYIKQRSLATPRERSHRDSDRIR